MFVGRDGRGPWTLKDPEGFISTTLEYQAGADIPIDYEHQTINADVNGQPAPAAGWIKALEARDDGIWGRVEWTKKAASMIAAKEYRYISPVMFTSNNGEVLRLQSAALVGLPNLELKSINKQGAQNMDFLQQLASLLGLEEGATEEAVFSAIKALVENKGAPVPNNTEPGAEGDTDKAQANQGDPAVAALPEAEAELLAAVETLVGTAEDAVDEAAANKIKTMLKANKTLPANAAGGPVNELLVKLVTRTDRLEKELNRTKAENLVGMAIKAGRLTPAVRDWAIDYATKDPVGLANLVKKMPVLVENNRSDGGMMARSSQGSQLSYEEKSMCQQLGLKESDYIKNRTALRSRS
jgi:phage I-like protein